MSSFFAIESVCVTILGHPISWIEFIGTVFGLLSVYFATRTNILTWSTGIVNEVFLFLLFFQINLYADMFLQVYFFAVTLYGWYSWKKDESVKKISELKGRLFLLLICLVIVFSVISGYFFLNIHILLPQYFTEPAAYPFVDSFILCASIVATVLLARKKMENWIFWISINVASSVVYALKGIYFLSLEYVVFTFMAIYGYLHWRKITKTYD